MSDLSRFSVISTNIKIINYKGMVYLEKRYKPNINLGISNSKLKQLIDEYIVALSNGSISIPEIRESFVDNNEIVYLCDFSGQNLIEMGFSTQTFNKYIPQIQNIMRILKLAQNAKLMIDPHPKNFVFKSSKITYVDFYPPYSDKYVSIRMRFARESEKKIIETNFEYFRNSYLAPHFCGDFLNIDRNSRIFFKQIYEMSIQAGIYDGNYEKFQAEAIKIRSTEDTRIRKGIFLI